MHGLTFGLTQVGTMGLMVHHARRTSWRGGRFLSGLLRASSQAAISIPTGAVYARYGQGAHYPAQAALAGLAALVMWSARKRLSAHQPQSEASGG